MRAPQATPKRNVVPMQSVPPTYLAMAAGQMDRLGKLPTQQIASGPSNFEAANTALNLTPQEQALYQRHLTNLTGPGGVDNANGSRSTLLQTSIEVNGKTYNIPTVWGGKILPAQEAIAKAKAEGLDKFPSYASEDEAEARYQQMHSYMDKDTAEFMKARK